jgi:hypothetical protein
MRHLMADRDRTGVGEAMRELNMRWRALTTGRTVYAIRAEEAGWAPVIRFPIERTSPELRLKMFPGKLLMFPGASPC